MNDVVCVRTYEVNSFLVNSQKKLGLCSLLNLIQDTAWAHATAVGHGFESAEEMDLIWVLTRQRLAMKEWPNWGEHIQIHTWVRPLNGPFGIRDFEIYLDGRVIGACTTTWLTLDVNTRKPIRIKEESFEVRFRTDYRIPFDSEKIPLQNDLLTSVNFKVRNSDLDMHHHVNNTKYAQWILDSIPLSWHHVYDLTEYEVNFLAEIKEGDEISIQYGERVPDDAGGGSVQFQGFRTSDRKIVFAARMTGTEKPLKAGA